MSKVGHVGKPFEHGRRFQEGDLTGYSCVVFELLEI